jgi:hypothetical protein
MDWREEPIGRQHDRKHFDCGTLGFYSISPGSIEFTRVPANPTRKLGRYDVPAFRLGRLAVDRSMQGQGLDGDLLLASGERALAIDAKDDKAARWYERFGALPLLDGSLKLILPLGVVADAIRATGEQRT